MRKKAYLLVMVILLMWVQAVPAFAGELNPADLEAKSAVVIDADTGKMLYEKDAHTRREPASITKIMTCMLALENLKLDQVVTISGPIQIVGNGLDLKPGEQITAEDLLYGLMVHSANDAAVALAEEVSGSVEEFAHLMTVTAQQCGAYNTKFLNPNGLNWAGQEEHLTTAYDMAMIARAAMRDEKFRELVSTVSYTIPATNKSGPRKLHSTNLTLWDTKDKIKVNGKVRHPKYEGSIGIKTGLTSTAGSCFVGEVEKNGTRLISVVLFSGNLTRYSDTIAMWEYCLDKYYTTHKVVKKGQELERVRIRRGAHRYVKTKARSDAAITIPKGETTKNFKTEFVSDGTEAPVKKGQRVGTVQVYNGDVLISSSDALAAEAVERGGPLSVFGIPDWMAILIYIIAAGCVLLLVNFKVIRPRKERARAARRRERQMAEMGARQKAMQQQRRGSRRSQNSSQSSRSGQRMNSAGGRSAGQQSRSQRPAQETGRRSEVRPGMRAGTESGNEGNRPQSGKKPGQPPQ